MTTTSEIKPGRIYTFDYSDPAIELKGYVNGAQGRELNPLAGCAVGVSRRIVVQAAGDKTWANVQRKANPNWQPSADYVAWWHVLPENSCIVEHNKEATRYLRGIPKGKLSEVYTIDGQPATPAQVATIEKFKKSKGGAEFCFLTLDKLNIIDETGEDE